MSYMSNLYLLMEEAGAKTKKEQEIFMAGFQAGMDPDNSKTIGDMAKLAKKATKKTKKWKHNFCTGCAEAHVDHSNGKILPKKDVACECSCHG